MNDIEFKNTVLKPSGELVPYIKDKKAEGVIPTSFAEYTNELNSYLDDLNNNIIPINNKSGIQYKVSKIDENGIWTIHTPKQTLEDGTVVEAGEQVVQFDARPGKWRGTVEDIPSESYLNSIPGLRATHTAYGLFPESSNLKGISGTGFYKSINEYLKKYDLGRLRDGDSGQTITRINRQTGKKITGSFDIWEEYVKKNKAIGFYTNYGQQVTAMLRTVFPFLTSEYLLQELENTDKEKTTQKFKQ
jgi:hypothetical protein